MNLNDLLSRSYKTPAFRVESDILAAAVKEREEEAKKVAVQATKGLLTQFEQTMTQNVANLRNLRKQEKEQAARVAKLDRALRYFGASGNPLPYYRAQGGRAELLAALFCQSVGIPVPDTTDPAWNVPEDFNPEAPKVD